MDDTLLDVVYGAPTEAEAALVAGLLEAAGIRAVILDSALNGYQVAMAVASRGYRVAVEKSQSSDAEGVLIENGFVIPELQEEVPEGAGVCSKCYHTVMPGLQVCQKCGQEFDWSA